MNLSEHNLWRKIKMWLVIAAPLFIVFLFINPYLSLFIFLLVIGKLLHIKLVQSILNKSAKKINDEENLKLIEIEKNIREALNKNKN